MSHMPFTDKDRQQARAFMAQAQARVAEHDQPQSAPATPPRPVRTLDPDAVIGSTPPRVAASRRESPQLPMPPRVLAALATSGAIVLVLGFLALRPQPTPAAPAPEPQQVAAAPSTIAPTADVAPTAAPAREQLAYDKPNGALIGPIPLDAAPAFRYGSSEWGGVRWGAGIVWVRSSPAALAGLPDLAPPTPAPTPQYAPPPPQWVPQERAPETTPEERATEPPPAASPTMIVPRPPLRPKPLQPPVMPDSGQPHALNVLEANGFPVASIRMLLALR